MQEGIVRVEELDWHPKFHWEEEVVRKMSASGRDCEEGSAAVNLGDGNEWEVSGTRRHNLGEGVVGF